MLPLLAVPPALCFCVPLVVVVLALRTLALRQHRQFLLLSSLALFSLALLASVVGILGLKAAGGLFTLSKVQLVVDNALYAELGASVLYLAVKHNSPTPWLPRSRHIKPYTGLLCSFLFCATAIGLATPFVLAIPPIVPPMVFLIFTVSTLPLLVHLIYFHCYPPAPSPSTRFKKKPSKLLKLRKKRIVPSVTVSGATSLPRLTMPNKNTTTITVLIPPPLPSPASSSASFPETDESKRHSHFKHPSEGEDPGPNEGSSCSTAILSGSKISTKLHEETESGHDANYAEHMGTDLEANPEFSLFTPTTAPSALALNIRKRATRLRMRSRSILIILLISQTFAILSGTLLLILGISDNASTASTALLRIVETAFIVLCISGFTFAFYLHGLPLDNDLSPSQGLADPGPITISIAPRQHPDDIIPGSKYHTEKEDKAVVTSDMIPHFVVDGGNYQGTSSWKPVPEPVADAGSRKYGLGIDKVFESAKPHFQHETESQNRERLGSASFPITSPHLGQPSISAFDEDKFEDEGIELPALATAQLPSPPNTPRAEEVEHIWRSGLHYPYNRSQEEQSNNFDQEQVRVGVMRPGIKVNVIREFEERGRYLEAAADVVDTAVSEPGCTSSSSGGDPNPRLSELRSPRVWFSQRTFSPTLKRSPAIMNDGPKSPPLKPLMMSPKSPTFPIFRSLTNPGSPGSAWKRAQRIKEKLRRPLIRHRSATASSLGLAPLEIAAPTPCTFEHRRTGSVSKIAEWYPFSSKNRRGKTEDKDMDGYWRAEKGQSSGEGGIEMADFVDLTDPFASPTPGFALPKWVDGGMAGSSSDVGHHRTISGDRSELTPIGSVKGKEREWNVAGGGRESERIRGVVNSSKATTWGRVPVVVGNELGYERDMTAMDYPSMLRSEKREKGRKRQISMNERRIGGRVVTRPDSPMPVPATLSAAHSRSISIDRMVGMLEDVVEIQMESGIGLESSFRRKREPIKQKGSQQSLRSARNGHNSGKPSVPSIPSSVSSYFSIPPPPPPLWLKDDIKLERFSVGDERGRLDRKENVLNMERTRNGSPIPIAVRPGLKTESRRKGSPVPILFRSSSGPSGGGDASVDRRYMREVSGRSSSSTSITALEQESVRGLSARGRRGDHTVKRYLDDEPSLEVELNLEEMLLAQKLLRRLDSVYCCDEERGEDLAKQ